MSDHSDYVTLCRAPGFTFTKTYRELPDGTRVKGPTGPPPSQVDPRSYEVDGLDDLARLLRGLLKRPELYVTRAEPVDPGPGLRRRLASDAHGDARNFRDVPRRWVCLDVDDLPTPDGLDPESDLEAAAEELRRALPVAFHTAACCVVWSRSFGTLGYLKLKAHLWFWLDRPAHGASLKAWLKGWPVDGAIFAAGQLHFTAAPRCVGFEDPLEGRRVTMLEGAPAVVLPCVVSAERPNPPARGPQSPRKAREGAARVLGQDVEPTATEEDVRAALARFSPDALRSEWFNVYLALWSGVGSAEKAFELFDEWSARGSKYEGRAATHRLCASFKFTSLPVDRLWTLSGYYPAPPFEGEDLADLAELRGWLEDLFGRLGRSGGTHVVAVPVGGGKSRAFWDWLEGDETPTGRKLVLVPTLDLRDEIVRARSSARAVPSRTAENCARFDVVQAANRAAPGGGAEFCHRCPDRGRCPFVALSRGAGAVAVTSHAMGLGKYGARIEELPLERKRPAVGHGPWVAPTLVDTTSQLEVRWSESHEGAPYAVATADADAAELDVPGLVEEGRYVPAWDLLAVDESPAGTCLATVSLRAPELRELTGLDLDELPERADELDWAAIGADLRRDYQRRRYLEAMAVPLEARAAELARVPSWAGLEALAQAAERGGAGASITRGRAVEVEGEMVRPPAVLHLPHVRTMDVRRARLVLGLDATATTAQARVLWGSGVELHRARVPKPESLEVVRVDATLGGRSRGPEGWRYETKAALWRATHLAEDGPTTLHVVHRAWAEWAEAELVGPAIYYGGTLASGSNAYSSCDRVCASTWFLPGAAVDARAELYTALLGLGFEEAQAAARYEMVFAGVAQAVGRARPYSGDPLRVVLVDERDLGPHFPELEADQTECAGSALARGGYVRGAESWGYVLEALVPRSGLVTRNGLETAWAAGCRTIPQTALDTMRFRGSPATPPPATDRDPGRLRSGNTHCDDLRAGDERRPVDGLRSERPHTRRPARAVLRLRPRLGRARGRAGRGPCPCGLAARGGPRAARAARERQGCPRGPGLGPGRGREHSEAPHEAGRGRTGRAAARCGPCPAPRGPSARAALGAARVRLDGRGPGRVRARARLGRELPERHAVRPGGPGRARLGSGRGPVRLRPGRARRREAKARACTHRRAAL